MRPTRTALSLAACLALTTAAGAAQASSRRTITQPAPPVTASAFGLEPAGVAPTDGDGLIPNPATPAGVAIAPPSSCTVTFASASGATSATVNSWIAANENAITAPAVVCLSGTFTAPVHVWSKSSAALLDPNAAATLTTSQIIAMCDDLLDAHKALLPPGLAR